MAAFYARPSTIVPQRGHPILKSETLWFVADRDNPPSDVLNSGYAAMSVGANPHDRNTRGTAYGSAFYFSPSASNTIDLGASNRFIASETQPFTIMWVEHPEVSIVQAYGICELKPGGSANSFFVGRGTGFSVGLATGVARSIMACSTLAPPITNNQTSVCIAVGRGGCASTTQTDWTFYVGGTNTGQVVCNSSPLLTTTSSSVNCIGQVAGSSTYGNLYIGHIDNLRIWNRALSDSECKALTQDPYLGCIRKRYNRTLSGASSTWFAPWTMLPCGFPP